MSAQDVNAEPTWLQPREQWAYLKNEWRLMFQPQTLLPDLLAGTGVALVALPLALAVASGSGVTPIAGLASAIIGGIVVALLGGSRLQVSGPAIAMSFLVSEILAKYGLPGLVAATIMAGLFQILAGVIRLGRFMRWIPRPVIAGFFTGIGITILCAQLPVFLGFDVSHAEEGGCLGILWQVLRRANRADAQSLMVGLTSLVTMYVLPRFSRRLPAPLIAVALASLVAVFFGWTGVPRLGDLPSEFPFPVRPYVPWERWNELVMAAVAIAVVASIESLLSASVLNSMANQPRTDNDQELVGQGIGNLASALFGGLPVTGVIARSATNLQCGARTRLAAIIHALILLAMLVFFAPWAARIPRAALAGVLVAITLRMIEVRLLRTLWRGSRAEAGVFLVTTAAIVVTDLIVGVPVGMIAALLYVVHETSRLDIRLLPLPVSPEGSPQGAKGDCPAVRLLRVEGPLFFASGFHLRSSLTRLQGVRCFVLDLEGVPFLDMTGAELFEETLEDMEHRGVKVVLANLSESVYQRLRGLSQEQFPALRAASIYEEIRDAMLHATTELRSEDLCKSCRAPGRCAALAQAIGTTETLERTPVPRVRAVVAGSGNSEAEQEVAADRGPSSPLTAITSESLRPSPSTSWNRKRILPRIAPSAFVDPLATVIGEVNVGENVFIGPGVSVRADEGTPFHIGADTNLQDGVTLHALKGKVVLVRGRPYAIYVGRNVCLTHHALVHGPCYIGDRCFIGFKSTVHDAIVGEGCVLGMGAVVIGVSLPPRRFVGHNVVVDTQEKAEALPPVAENWEHLRDEVVEVNQELAAGHLMSHQEDGREETLAEGESHHRG